jgi:integrase
MGIYQRPDSPDWWMLIERAGQKALRLSTGIPVDGGSDGLTKALKQQAQETYAIAKADLARKRFKLPETVPTRSFADHRAWYATHVSTQKRGTTRELSMLKQLGRFFDATPLTAITVDVAREWRTARLQDVSASTVRREEALLKHLLTTAVPTYLERNPLTGFRRIRVADTDTRVLTADEERRLLKALRTAEDRALVIGATDTLLRLSNMKNLTRAQDHGRYLFSDSKVGAVRIPISRRLRRALDGLPKKGAAYFPTYAGKSNNLVIRMFSEACARAKVQTGRKTGGVSFHCLRHTGATRMLAAGVDVKTVMEIGGWKNLKVMERYLHPTDERKQAAVNAIGRRTT